MQQICLKRVRLWARCNENRHEKITCNRTNTFFILSNNKNSLSTKRSLDEGRNSFFTSVQSNETKGCIAVLSPLVRYELHLIGYMIPWIHDRFSHFAQLIRVPNTHTHSHTTCDICGNRPHFMHADVMLARLEMDCCDHFSNIPVVTLNFCLRPWPLNLT